MQHLIEITQDTVLTCRCSVCGVSWKKEPVSECPGCKMYGYEKIPWRGRQ